MSKTKFFLIILGASFLWHLAWFSMTKIVINTSPAKDTRYSKVSFLGPLLDQKDSGKVYVSQKTSSGDKLVKDEYISLEESAMFKKNSFGLDKKSNIFSPPENISLKNVLDDSNIDAPGI